MNKFAQPILCLVTDRGLCRDRPLEQVVEQALAGGATMIQLREKHAPLELFLQLARTLLPLVHRHGAPLIINDRVDVALMAGADGVHLGQRDMPCIAARRMLGPEKIIGLSVENVEQAVEAESFDVDYIGISPVFATATKTDTAPALGLEGVAAIRRLSRHPLVAIGGLHEGNVASVMKAGAHGVAVVSAICAADDPKHAARSIRERIDGVSEGAT